MKLAITLAWLVAASGQNAAGLAAQAPSTALCGSAYFPHSQWPGRKSPERDCPGACHAMCRKQIDIGGDEEE